MRSIRILCTVQALTFILAVSLPVDAGSLAGSVEVTVKKKRVANRYPGAGGGDGKPLQVTPSVVFVRGGVPGHPAPQGRESIVQKDQLFEPNLVILGVGSTVDFPNQDDEFHNVFSYSKTRRFDLGRYRKGESKSVEFTSPGVVKIYCEIHPWMRAAAVVVENPFVARVDSDGRYRIDGIPPGEYEVVVWNMDTGSESFTVEVASDGETGRDFKVSEAPSNLVPEAEIRVAAGGRGCCGSGGGNP